MLQKFKSLTFSAEYIKYGNKNRRTISRNITHKTLTRIRHRLFFAVTKFLFYGLRG